MAKTVFKYYNREYSTHLTDNDEIERYTYTNFFDKHDKIVYDADSIIGVDYMEAHADIIRNGGYYPEEVSEIVIDLVDRVKDCCLVSCDGYDILTQFFTSEQINTFIEIMQNARNGAIPIDFYFGEYYKPYTWDHFSIDC